ncbi:MULTISPECIES: class C sortase [unclassified Leucobacter]|uniref:class C sortase n=1 Tax=unclassified Leucobacter TaxID=2621730 RepID=UPI00165D3AC0|nr:MULTISPECIES: class C sortase [unclassified Leucobacter]MBC9936667.1 class C sortase [Leucobacter sp. cx-87]
MSTIIDQEPQAAPARAGSWRFPRFAFFTALLALTGLLIFLYPGVASWFSQYAQSQIIKSVEVSTSSAATTQREAEIDRARAYNEALVGGALVGANTNVPTGAGTEGGEFDYDRLLPASADGAMARLRIPAIDVDLPIYHGTSDQTLERGVGHLQGTSLPVGGVDQHSVLTAHRGLASAELFTHLDQVKAGEIFTIEVFGEVISYKVVETQVVEPSETQALYPEYGRDLVTLVTCTPLGINSHRILVTGERITPTPIGAINDAGKAPDIPGFPWWAVGIGVALALLTAYVWRMGRVGALPAPRAAAQQGWGIAPKGSGPHADSAPEHGAADGQGSGG